MISALLPRSAALGLLIILGGSCDREPPPFDGRPVRIEGRVVGVDGRPERAARVDLVSPPYPDMPMSVVRTAVTDARGAFGFELVPLGAVSHVVIASRGARRTYFVAVPPRGPETLRLEDLVFAPDRELLVTAQCPTALAAEPSTGEPSPIWVELHWRGHRSAQAQLLATDGTPASDGTSLLERPLAPGFDERARVVPPEARRFERRLRVPSGAHEVRVSGGCGERTTSVEVPAEGEIAPLVLALEAEAP